MQLLFDFLPVIVFFAVYKAYDIYVATAAIMIVMAVQIGIQWFRHGTVSKLLLTSGLLVAVLGGMTLVLRDPLFIQWKLTIINALFALAFFGSQFIGQRNLTERLMGHAAALPKKVWGQLNLMWVANFTIIAVGNIYVVNHYSLDVWVNFKVYGTLGLTLLTALGQGIWIATIAGDQPTDAGDQQTEN